jgi:asparagine synthase (glutamine-hydrolysing)
MCGIAGYAGTRTIEEPILEGCLRLMRRRGPDDAAYRRFVNGAGRNTYLLHSRLSIIDLDSRSNQPFQCGSKWLVLNGELYNYVEVRCELEKTGVQFKTSSDTEVLAKAIDINGWSILDHCEGMWAFAVYDETDGSLTLSRDRFAEKPLYVFRDGGGVYFGSEVKFIAALLGRRLEPDFDHMYRYLVNGYRALNKGSRTFFKGLSELPAATTLRIDETGAETAAAYWRPVIDPDDDMTYDEAVGGTRERVLRSMEIRLRADVPLAFCMSGGIDSNSLICTAKRVFGYDVHGFTITNTDMRYDEQEMVDCVVATMDVRHTAIPVARGRFLERLRTLVRHHDAPVYTISYYVHWLLQQSIADHGYKVAISGTAADELFTGYYDHHNAYLYEVRNDPVRFASALAEWSEHVQPIVRNPFLGNPRVFIDDPTLRDHLYLDAPRFAAYLRKPWAEAFEEREYSGSLLRNRMLNELFNESVPQILHEDDLNAMYFSIENRSPFLDRRLFEFSGRIPTKHLVREGRAKAVLRDAMRGIVPGAVLDNRRKVGFNAPILDLLDADNPAERQALLGDSPIWEHVDRDRIARLLDKRELPNSESKFLFYFLNAKMFVEEFAA